MSSTEYAGELKDFFPDKKVTIVQNSSMLLNDTYSDRARRQIERDLRVRGVDIIFNDRVDDVDTTGNTSGTVKTRAGKVIEGDLIVRFWFSILVGVIQTGGLILSCG